MKVQLAMMWLFGVGCLPADSRPEPGSLAVTIASSSATTDGFTTADGWIVRFDQVLASLGEVELESREDTDDDCVQYDLSRYNRLFDFTQMGRENLNLVHGLGTCDVRFEYGPPSSDSVLGPGVTERDRAEMRIEGDNGYAQTERAALVVRGSAQRDAVTKRFTWTFRQNVELFACGYLSEVATLVVLTGGRRQQLQLEVSGEQLFRDSVTSEGELRFDAFAAADADNDGSITMEELRQRDAHTTVDLARLDIDLPIDPAALTVADVLYWLQFTSLPHVVGGGRCRFEIDTFGGG